MQDNWDKETSSCEVQTDYKRIQKHSAGDMDVLCVLYSRDKGNMQNNPDKGIKCKEKTRDSKKIRPEADYPDDFFCLVFTSWGKRLGNTLNYIELASFHVILNSFLVSSCNLTIYRLNQWLRGEITTIESPYRVAKARTITVKVIAKFITSDHVFNRLSSHTETVVSKNSQELTAVASYIIKHLLCIWSHFIHS